MEDDCWVERGEIGRQQGWRRMTAGRGGVKDDLWVGGGMKDDLWVRGGVNFTASRGGG